MVRHAEGGTHLAGPDEARDNPQNRIGNIQDTPRCSLPPRNTTWNRGSFGWRCQAGGMHMRTAFRA
jgi:hypothetical protein